MKVDINLGLKRTTVALRPLIILNVDTIPKLNNLKCPILPLIFIHLQNKNHKTMSLVRKVLLLGIITLAVNQANAQQHDLNYFLDQAKLNSPLLQKNKADNELLKLDMQQTERILKSPVISLESNILFAPIISHDVNVRKFELTSPGATNYIGYDQAFTDGGQYQALLNLSQPLFRGSSLRAFKNKNVIASKLNEDTYSLNVHELEQLVGYQFLICEKSKLQLDNIAILNAQLDKQMGSMKKLVEHAIYKKTDEMLLDLELPNKNHYNKIF